MKRAEKQERTGGWLLPVMVVALILGAGLAGWREWRQRAANHEWQQQLAAAGATLAETETELERAHAGLQRRRELLTEAEERIQTLGDRVANLEAQREHLRAENDRQAERARTAEATAEEMRASLEGARHELLLARERPDLLASELTAAHGRISELEELLDRQAAATSSLPAELTVAGLSSDSTVFALEDGPPPQGELPCPIHLCSKDGILLDGWIHRLEGDRLIGHVKRWHSPSSALVKGEKVFILPGKSHEADY